MYDAACPCFAMLTILERARCAGGKGCEGAESTRLQTSNSRFLRPTLKTYFMFQNAPARPYLRRLMYVVWIRVRIRESSPVRFEIIWQRRDVKVKTGKRSPRYLSCLATRPNTVSVADRRCVHHDLPHELWTRTSPSTSSLYGCTFK
jgi:hypothetical protein